MQFWITLGLVGWAIVGPLASWGLTDLKAKWIDIPNIRAAATREATDAEHQRGQQACDARVAVIQQELSEAAARARRLAEEAEISIGPTPVEKAELQHLCNQSASCRSREKGTTP